MTTTMSIEGLRHGSVPSYYDTLARALGEIGEHAAAAVVWERAASVSMGHNRTARYTKEAQIARQRAASYDEASAKARCAQVVFVQDAKEKTQ